MFSQIGRLTWHNLCSLVSRRNRLIASQKQVAGTRPELSLQLCQKNKELRRKHVTRYFPCRSLRRLGTCPGQRPQLPARSSRCRNWSPRKRQRSRVLRRTAARAERTLAVTSRPGRWLCALQQCTEQLRHHQGWPGFTPSDRTRRRRWSRQQTGRRLCLRETMIRPRNKIFEDEAGFDDGKSIT